MNNPSSNTKRLPKIKRNALWFMFTGEKKSIQFGTNNYHIHNPELSTTLYNTLFEYYSEKKIMTYSVEDFNRDYIKRNIHYLPPKDRLEGLSTNDLLKRLSINDRLGGLSTNDLLKRLPKKEIQKFLQDMV